MAEADWRPSSPDGLPLLYRHRSLLEHLPGEVSPACRVQNGQVEEWGASTIHLAAAGLHGVIQGVAEVANRRPWAGRGRIGGTGASSWTISGRRCEEVTRDGVLRPRWKLDHPPTKPRQTTGVLQAKARRKVDFLAAVSRGARSRLHQE
ncbi:hypothetical protein THAOC_13979 [Thalassiosira oceanica]|uniref:Uncharacterized protein n=1 Tax=Thalassiosira oceanica TaxID=159749 RepID=K0SJT9_THAOC|nr:hypothetical protein THAOC_13979 [Thalassiosira oceanica]|eukprot:EJK65194.1 hypothetical protein THAOC_13979 [Thalassiosira oceanica]